MKNSKSKGLQRPRRRRRRSHLLRELLSAQRKMAGLTREELAKRAGVTVTTIEKAETGSSECVPFKDLYAIGLVLGASMAVSHKKPQPPIETEEILREFDQLLESKRGKVFVEQQPDQEHALRLLRIDGHGIKEKVVKQDEENCGSGVRRESASKVRSGL